MSVETKKGCLLKTKARPVVKVFKQTNSNFFHLRLGCLQPGCIAKKIQLEPLQYLDQTVKDICFRFRAHHLENCRKDLVSDLRFVPNSVLFCSSYQCVFYGRLSSNFLRSSSDIISFLCFQLIFVFSIFMCSVGFTSDHTRTYFVAIKWLTGSSNLDSRIRGPMPCTTAIAYLKGG